MKIAVPIDESGQDPAVAASFGRASSFLIYDEESGLKDILDNSAAQSAGGAGIKAAQTIIDSGTEILLTPQCGGNAARVLLAADMKLYKTEPGLSAMDNIRRFREDGLDRLDDIHEGFHRH